MRLVRAGPSRLRGATRPGGIVRQLAVERSANVVQDGDVEGAKVRLVAHSISYRSAPGATTVAADPRA